MTTKFLTHTQKIIKQNRDNRRFLVNLLIFSLIGISHVASASNQHSTTYTQSQIDSLVSVEVQRQIENQLDIKLQVTTYEALNKSVEKYISIENNHLNFLGILVTILTFTVATFIPYMINKRYEKKIDDRLDNNQKRMDEYIKESENKIKQLVRKELENFRALYEDLATKLSTQQNFAVLLIRALSNKDEDVQLSMLNEMIRDYAGDIKVCVAYNCRGNIYKRRQKYDNAISDYNKAIELDPKFADAYSNRGLVYVQQKDYEQAIADYTKAIELNPNHAEAYCNRGNVYYDTNNYEQAIADYNKAIELNPNDATTYCNRGNAYCLKEDYEHAIADYNKAIELNPNDAKAYYNRGLFYKFMDKKNKAKADFQKAKELGYNPPPKK